MAHGKSALRKPPAQIGVAFIGPQGSGKSTLAHALTRKYQPSQVISLANALREEVARMYSDNSETRRREILEELVHPEKKKIWRPILQVHGTEYRRVHFGDDYWITRHRNALYEIPDEVFIAVDDVRFNNELDYAAGERLWPIIRCEDRPRSTQELAELELLALQGRDPRAHASEVDWQAYEPDAVIPWGPIELRVAYTIQALHNFYIVGHPREQHFIEWVNGRLKPADPPRRRTERVPRP